MLLASADLMAGRKGGFMVLDARSHRLQRVCRSTFSAELLGVEEGMDVGHYCRGCLAESLGCPMDEKHVDKYLETVPLTVVADAKDVYNKGCSDTPSYGAQKSLAFTVAGAHQTSLDKRREHVRGRRHQGHGHGSPPQHHEEL